MSKRDANGAEDRLPQTSPAGIKSALRKLGDSFRDLSNAEKQNKADVYGAIAAFLVQQIGGTLQLGQAAAYRLCHEEDPALVGDTGVAADSAELADLLAEASRQLLSVRVTYEPPENRICTRLVEIFHRGTGTDARRYRSEVGIPTEEAPQEVRAEFIRRPGVPVVFQLFPRGGE